MVKAKDLKKDFKDKNLFDLAFTHRSWVNENPEKRGTNERLEFLGDAVLELAISKELYEKFPDKDEGYLTALRANLVNTQNLASVAKKMGVGKLIYLAKGEEQGGGKTNSSILANTLEAIIGAIYLDRGDEAANEFIVKQILSNLSEKLAVPLKGPKSRLQETVQAKKLPAPRYKVIREEGPDHSKKFVVAVFVNNKEIAVGKGRNKLVAEKRAAEKALSSL